MAEVPFYDRVKVETSTTGTGSSVAVGDAVAGYLTPAEAGVQDGAVVNYVIEDGDDFEFQPEQTYSSTGPSLTRGTPSLSKIAGIVGTTQLPLSGNATVSIVPLAQQLRTLRGPVNVMDYIPKSEWAAIEAGTSTTDVVSYINAAATAAGASGRRLYLPAGTYVVGGSCTIGNDAYWYGDGPLGTVIKAANGANADVIRADSANRWTITDLQVDGNNSNRAGIRCLGAVKFYIDRVFIKNCVEDGLYLDGPDSGDTWGMEPTVTNVTVDTVGYHGIRYLGAHDGHFSNIAVIDAGKSVNNGFSGLHIGPTANGRFFNVHCWSRSTTTNRMAYAVDVAGSGCEFIGCHFEGAYSANVHIVAHGTVFKGTRCYAAWNGVNVLLRAPLCRLDLHLEGPGLGRPACKGVVLGLSASDNVSSNYIEISGTNQGAGFIDFTNSVGTNTIIARGYNGSGTNIVGTPHAADVCIVDIGGPSATKLRQNVT